ncbi:MAG TPA: hypothetical protein VKM72_32980 [Thermoanaerobaculia bacterium]|nr:hypothetical protein [Thermoanaerobaculia bacterium]
MFRMKRTRSIALALLLGAMLLPLPAMAGSFGEQTSTLSWDGLWSDLLAWFGLGPEADSYSSIDPNGKPDSSYIDPLGGPRLNTPSWGTAEDSSSIDPLGGGPNSSSFIDPDGKP